MVPRERAWSIATTARRIQSYVLNVELVCAIYDRKCNVKFALFDRKSKTTPPKQFMGA
jgi:hypothetical protein